MHIGKELREIKLNALIKAEGYEELDDLLRIYCTSRPVSIAQRYMNLFVI